MAWMNENFLKLSAGYLFPEIARRVKVFCDANPELALKVIRCGIGDVTEPLPEVAVAALREGAEDLAVRDRFQGYGPPTGHDFVRAAIAQSMFRERGVDIADDDAYLTTLITVARIYVEDILDVSMISTDCSTIR
jgi:LL-diaminopimelate aminotransferase